MAAASKSDSSNTLMSGKISAEQDSSHRLRILVADDNHINQKVISSLHNKMGHRADVVGNGKEALEAFKLVPYDIILMDIQMPEVDGLETCRQIRALEVNRGRHTPIIAITAHARKVDRDECLAAGMDDYVSKPINPGDLRAALARRITAAKTIPLTNPTPEPSTHADILNFSTALSLVDGNRELLCEVARIFLDQYP
jgi:two-component system sensor histidine kinase/response regulator